MKSTVNYLKTQGSALALVLTFLFAGCGYALLRAFSGGMASGAIGSFVLPLF